MPHSYEEEEEIKNRTCRKAVHLAEIFKMHAIVTALDKMFYGYKAIRKYVDSRCVIIYNAGESFLYKYL